MSHRPDSTTPATPENEVDQRRTEHDVSIPSSQKITASSIGMRNLLTDILRRNFGEDLILDEISVSKLTADKGEGNGSVMVSVTATVRKNDSSTPEIVNAVAKLFPNEYYQKLFNTVLRFQKEIIAYEEIFPAYNQLQKENGVPIDKVFDIFPKYLGSKMPDERKTCSSGGHDAIILLENLNPDGYVCGNRLEGLDLAHSEMVVRNLGTFHALGIALKLNKPELFDQLRMKATVSAIPEVLILAGIENGKKLALKNEQLKPFYNRIAAALDIGFGKLKSPCLSDFGTLSHEDFWVANIMFQRDSNGSPKALKFVDFQTYSYQSPVKDLLYFLMGSTEENVLVNNFDKLIDSYHESFIETLVKLNCDVIPYVRDKFDIECKEWVTAPMAYGSAMVKAILLPESELTMIDGIPLSVDGYNNLDFESNRRRLTLMFLWFLKKNWI